MALLIRLAREADADQIASVYRPYVEASRISFEERPPDAGEMAHRIVGTRPGYHPWFVAEEDGLIIGYAGSSPYRVRPAYRWTVETGIYLPSSAQGRGLGRTLLTKLLETLERQGYVAAIGAIALPNDASVALHEKLGFVHTATYSGVGYKLGQWVDVGRWQRDLAPRVEKPAEPLPFASVKLS